MSVRTPAQFSLEQYFALEDMSQDRHEFVDGTIYGMVGGTVPHAVLCSNTVAALSPRLKGKPCKAVGGEPRLFIPNARVATYPDVAVYCGPIQLLEGRKDTALNPKVVVEVLSRSTRAYDRGEKFDLYQQIESLQQYVLVHQDRPVVEVFTRLQPGVWDPMMAHGMDAVLTLASLEVQVPLQELYDGVTLEP